MSDMPFKIKHCVKCKYAFWRGPDYAAGIMGPCLDDCGEDVCPFGNKWEDYICVIAVTWGIDSNDWGI